MAVNTPKKGVQTPQYVSIFREDIERINNWTLQYPESETGGNIFGLWKHDGNFDLRVVTGPGQNCRRTSASFNQDVNYLKRVGEHLTRHHGLRHIGEWHSHHQMTLTVPSSGDEHTIWTNLPETFPSFLLLITNIDRSGRVILHPYFFVTGLRRRYFAGNVRIIERQNSYMKKPELLRNLTDGAEQFVSTSRYTYSSSREKDRSCCPTTTCISRTTEHRTAGKLYSDKVRGAESKRWETTYQAHYPDYKPYSPDPYLPNSYSSDSHLSEVSRGREAHVKRSQWYSTSQGQKILRSITEKLQSDLMSNKNELQMSRDESSHDLHISFPCRDKIVELDFPSNFPDDPIKAKVTSKCGVSVTSDKLVITVSQNTSEFYIAHQVVFACRRKFHI